VKPDFNQEPTSEDFYKLAADFFAGKEVQSTYQFAPAPSAALAANYSIVNYTNPATWKVYTLMNETPAFARYLFDVMKSNLIQARKDDRLQYNDADIDKRVQTVEDLGDVEDVSVDHEIGSSDKTEFVFEKQEATSPDAVVSSSATKSDDNAVKGEDWMVIDQNQKVAKVPKKSTKKGKKKSKGKGKNIAPSQIDGTGESANDGETLPPTVREAPGSDSIENPSLNAAESGEWKVVPKKEISRPDRALGGLYTPSSSSNLEGQVERNVRHPGPMLQVCVDCYELSK
jgi:hypothetical protein